MHLEKRKQIVIAFSLFFSATIIPFPFTIQYKPSYSDLEVLTLLAKAEIYGKVSSLYAIEFALNNKNRLFNPKLAHVQLIIDVLQKTVVYPQNPSPSLSTGIQIFGEGISLAICHQPEVSSKELASLAGGVILFNVLGKCCTFAGNYYDINKKVEKIIAKYPILQFGTILTDYAKSVVLNKLYVFTRESLLTR